MGGKGDFDFDVSGGAEPRDDYIPMAEALPIDFPVFEDGAGEIEEFVTSGAGQNIFYSDPYWYFQSTFTFSTTPGTDGYFGFSDTVHYIPPQRKNSLGDVLIEGDHYIDFTNNRVYSWGGVGSPDPGSQPINTTFVHMCERQFTVSGAGQIVLLEDHYEEFGGMGAKRIGSFRPTYRTDGDVNTAALHSQQVLNFLNGRCYGFAANSLSRNQWNVTPSRAGRGGFYYSEDDGETWHRSTGFSTKGPPWRPQAPSYEGDQGLNNEPVERDLDAGDPGFPGVYQWNLTGSEIPYGGVEDITNITNATQYNTPTGPIGFMPMSGDGTFGMFFSKKTPGTFYTTGELTFPGLDVVDAQSYGKGWRAHPQIPYHASKKSLLGNGVISGNSMRLLAVCRDARTLVDPITYGGNVFGITREREVIKISVDATVWLGGSPTVTKQYVLPGIASDAQSITSTYDPLTGKMWLHAFTRWNNLGGSGTFGFYYSRSDDEGLSWTTINFPAVHDPWWGHGNWRYDGEAKHAHTLQFLVSPESQTLWVSMYSQVSFGFLSYRYVASHIFRSIDHGVTWDKLSAGAPFDTGSGTGTQGWSRGADGFFRTPGWLSTVFLGDPLEAPPTEFYIFADQWQFTNIFHFKVNYTGAHGAALDSITFPSFEEEPHIAGNPDIYGGFKYRGWIIEFSGSNQGDTFLDDHSPNYDGTTGELPCGFQKQGATVQKMNDYYFRSGGFGKHYTLGAAGRPTGCDQYNANEWDRGDYVEFSILPLDATFDFLCDEAGFVIRAPHVNTLRTKLSQLNSNVITGGTEKVSFGIDFGALIDAGLPVTAGKSHVRAPHWASLVNEFIDIVAQVGTAPGGPWFTENVDLTAEFLSLLIPPSADEAVSIRILIAMRKIIQNLYLSGWYCSCYSYCPCQTDITISGGGGKK